MNDDEREPKVAAEADQETEQAEAPPSPATPSRPRPKWLRPVQLLLPLLLSAGAVGVHWALNVPDKIQESPHDQGSKKKKPRAKDKDKDKRNDRGRLGRNARQPPRSAEELELDWKRYGSLPFEDEPIRSDWARRHQAIVNRAVVVARREAFRGAPERPQVVLVEATCRTVRCRVLVRSPHANELELFGDAFGRVEAAGESVWRSFELEPAEAPNDTPEPTQDHFVRIIVSFETDETNTRDLKIPAEDDEEEGADEEGANEDEGSEEPETPQAATPEPGGA